jgi:hypothetical protein
VDHDEEGLLKRIFDGGCSREDLIEALLNDLWPFQWMEYGAANRDRNRAQAPACLGIAQQVVRERA